MTELDSLRTELDHKEAELLQLKLELIDNRIAELQRHDADQEQRLRTVETARTRLETLAWLAFGGGAVSLLNILKSVVR